MATKSDNSGKNSLGHEGMDLSVLYAGSDFSYLTDDRSGENTDDEGAANRGDEVADDKPVHKGKKAEEAEIDDGQDEVDEGDDDDEQEGAEGGEDEGEEGEEGEEGVHDGGGESDGDDERLGSVPKWRLDQQTKKLRQTQREMESLKKQVEKLTKGDTRVQDDQHKDAPDPDQEFKGQLKALRDQRNNLRDQYEDAIIEGDTKKIRSLRGQLDDVEDQMLDARLTHTTNRVKEETRSQTSIEAKLQKVADEVQERFAPLNPEDDNYDEDMVQEVVAYRDALINRGSEPEVALRKAAETIAKGYDIPDAKAGKAKSKSEGKGKTPAKQPAKGTKNKQDMAKRQPPKMPGTKNAPKAPDVLSMTDAEFAKLSPEEIAKRRGDYRVD